MILGLCIASGAGARVWSCKIRLPCREGEKEGEGGREGGGGGGEKERERDGEGKEEWRKREIERWNNWIDWYVLLNVTS